MKNESAFPREVMELPGFTKLEYAALHLLQGYLASGRNETVIDGKPMSIEEASVIRAEKLFNELSKEKK